MPRRISSSEGAEVRTIEGLGGDHPLQHHFMNEVGAQCGICTPGMIMAALTLGPAPTLDDVKTALAGNLCRCTGYAAIYRAVLKWRGMRSPMPRTSREVFITVAIGQPSFPAVDASTIAATILV